MPSIVSFFGVKTDEKMSNGAFRVMWLVMKTLDSVFGYRRQIVKPGGFLIVDDGHQSCDETRAQIADSDVWSTSADSKDHLRCTPV